MTMKPTLEFRWDVRNIEQSSSFSSGPGYIEQRLFLQQLWRDDERSRDATTGDVLSGDAGFIGEILGQTEWRDIPGLGIMGIKIK